MTQRRSSRPRQLTEPIPLKANKVLNIILVIMVLIVIRLWHLSIIQHEEKIEEARKPQRRTVVERAPRASIRDRFNEPLAINQVQYNANISYALIKEIPSIITITDKNGKKIKQLKRKEHIKNISTVIAKVLNLDPERLEDLIHSKGALLNHIPLVIRENLTEQEYFRLKILEKDLIGLQVERVPKRYYPKGCVGCDIIGYLGFISKEEFDAIIAEINLLQKYLNSSEEEQENEPLLYGSSHAQIRQRLKELQERAYTINDYVGKSGIERAFDATLRGFRGKKLFYTDSKGNFLRELPGSKKPLSGQRVLLTISAELQEFAEAILAENESLRDGKSIRLDKKTKTYVPIKQPWIKGGVIVAMDPNNGEVLALASYPRTDPNDFIPTTDPIKKAEKASHVYKWLESYAYIAELWNQKIPLTRERYSFKSQKFYEESKWITWENFLEFILDSNHPVRDTLTSKDKIHHASTIIQATLELEKLFHNAPMQQILNALFCDTFPIASTTPSIEQIIKDHPITIQKLKKILEPFFALIPSNYDKLLLLDLYFLAVNPSIYSIQLLDSIGDKTLSNMRQIESAFASIQEVVQDETRTLFRQHDFKEWRKLNQKGFLEAIRAQEKELHTYNKPYIDHLDNQEKALFNDFWKEHKLSLLLVFLNGNQEFITLPEVYKNHFIKRHLELHSEDIAQNSWHKRYVLLSKEVSQLPSSQVITFLSSLRSFNDLNKPLFGNYSSLRNIKGIQLQKHLAASFYPKNGFGYGRSHAFRQSVQLGSIFKLVTAYTALIQPYKHNYYPVDHTLSNKELNPLTVIDDLHRSGKKSCPWNVGYFPNGEVIPQYYKGGRIPKSQHAHIGKVDLADALETSSNLYFALLAGDIIDKPEDLIESAKNFSYGSRTGIALPGEFAGNVPHDVIHNKSNLYAFSIGQHSFVTTPLQTAVMLSTLANKGFVLQPNIVLLKAGKSLSKTAEELFSQKTFPYQETLQLAGIDFPLFTEALLEYNKNSVLANSTTIKRKVFLPDSVRKYLLDSMNQVIKGSKGTAREQHIKTFSHRPHVITDYLDLQNQLIGKTSTAEMMERIDLSENGVHLVNHIGFSGISFEPANIPEDVFSHPELVIIVYLRFGDYGKEAAPIAAQIVKKWREIKSKNSLN
ncbi:MAG: penicillin-binding transpeptidase domain-containing protein [Chlamydiales bacterium]|nr:penicillin-binding transpeptidase domain-containing protein [Chlamydiales bacterium]